MSDYRQQIGELLTRASELPEGNARMSLVEQAVQLADTHRDARLAFQVRVRLCGEALDAGRPDVMATAFTWCISRSDGEPDLFPEMQLLWMFRWVIDELTGFVSVPREQLDALLADMERRYRAVGSTMRGYHYLRQNVALNLGDRVMAEEARQAIARCERDWLSDPAAAEQTFDVRYLVFFRRDQEAIERAAPLLRGEGVSEHYQGAAMTRSLLPLLRLGRGAEAMRYHHQGYQLIARHPRYVSRLAQHALFLTLTGNHDAALTLFVRHLERALASVDDDSHYSYLRAGRFILTRLAEIGQTTLRLRFKPRFPLFTPTGEYRIDQLLDWLVQQTTTRAQQFDQRNGNDHYSRNLAELNEMPSWACPIPLSP